ncbi:glycosyltransferase [Halococcus agarilyticus]|uniref:glycosyltransferase n=1 Tax=Halococcus agarilyticus TaxID=1232219 RepID=UPI000677AD33|nr:glycosyltransferase family 2 protein [Halococcus agarilyticus]
MVFVPEDVPFLAVVASLWFVLGLYGLSALWWLVETIVLSWGWRGDGGDRTWGVEDVQVRVLTIGAEAVVQGTVDSIPDGIDDVRVVSERKIDIDGATVHVVPESFECTATNKGRALEWARRNVECGREYVLYLDEDTLVTGFTGIPDADIVQFTEKPLYTGSWLTYCCEVFRVGYQFEQYGFHRLSYPLYAWGGGVAVRHSIERAITWDVATITEDTNFIWRAADRGAISYRLVDARFRNQAPPSLRAMIKQRRRWMSGTVRDGGLLPRRYRPLYLTRAVAWGFSPLVPVLVVVTTLLPSTFPYRWLYAMLSIGLFGILFVYMLAGLVGYRKHPVLWPVFVVLTPLAALFHAIGALWGIVRPIERFEVTEKVSPAEIEAEHPELEPGAIADHDGTERLVRESADEYSWTPFEDDVESETATADD